MIGPHQGSSTAVLAPLLARKKPDTLTSGQCAATAATAANVSAVNAVIDEIQPGISPQSPTNAAEHRRACT